MKASLRRVAALAVLAGAQAQSAVFSADLTAARATDLSGVMLDSFGSSHGSTTLRADWRAHFAKVKQEIGFNRVRFHGIFDDDLSTYLNGRANGALVFNTLDFLVAQGVVPTLELSFMPEELASDPTLTTFHYKGGISPPKNWTAWGDFVQQFMGLVVQRYGLQQVQNWRVEVWNEPNCGFYYQGGCCGPTCGNQTAYFQLYAATAQAVKRVSSTIPVGGPATAQLAWLPEFLQFCKSSGAPVDFVSTHMYPTDSQLNHTRDIFTDSVQAAADTAAAAGLPLYLTEFNAGLDGGSNGYDFLDGPYAGAFVLHNHLAAQSLRNVPSVSWWTFTDFGFEEGGADPMPWHNKFGIQNMYGVPKPVYRAMQLIGAQVASVTSGGGGLAPVNASGNGARQYLNSLGAVVGATVGTIDVSVNVASGSAAGSFTVSSLLTNFDLLYAGIPLPNATAVTLSFMLPAGTTSAPTSATWQFADTTHANPSAVWKAAGSPLYPSSAEIAAEMAASELSQQTIALTPAGRNIVQATVTLQPFAFGQLTFTYTQ